MKNTANNLANGTQTKAAHALRKELADEHGVPTKFIKYGDCLAVVRGTRKRCNVRNHFLIKLGTVGDAVCKWLLCDPDTPLMWTQEQGIEAMRAMGITNSNVGSYFARLNKEGFIEKGGMGYWNVKRTVRPFPQPMCEG